MDSDQCRGSKQKIIFLKTSDEMEGEVQIGNQEADYFAGLQTVIQGNWQYCLKWLR